MKIMRRFIFSLLTAAFIVSGMPSVLNAQGYDNTPVTISKEKVRINGQICYSHIVLEKQTLFSISKAYNVSLDDIYRYNPAVKEKGLQKNSILIIPIVEQPAAAVSEEAASDPAENPQKGNMQDMNEDAPEETLPEAETKAQSEETAQRLHVVRWFEDLDMIAKKYGVSVEAIQKANGLKGRKLTKRQKLIIPYPDEIVAEPAIEPADMQETADTTQVSDSTADKKTSILEGLFFPKKEVNITLLMPFNTTGAGISTGNMDFYSGALLAVYDAAKEGTSCDLNVYDTNDSSIQVSKDELDKSDVVIGPVSTAELKRILEMDLKAVVSPLDQKAAVLAETFSDMIQAPVPLDIQYKDLIQWIDEDMQYSDRFIVISEKGGIPTDATLQMKAAADSSGLEFKHLEYSILEGRDISSSLEYIMTESGSNRVYIASDSEAFVNDVVRNLNLMVYNKYEVVLYAPSRIRNYETIEVEHFHNTSLHISAGYYIDYNDPRVQEFLLKYRALYNTEPTQFAFQGYDLARYFIGIITRYGNRWPAKLEDYEASMLQSTFKFVKVGESGYVNTGVRRITYDDGWLISRIR